MGRNLDNDPMTTQPYIPRKPFCVNGHARIATNLRPDGHCRSCERERDRRRARDRKTYHSQFGAAYRANGGVAPAMPCCGHARSDHDRFDGMRCYFPGCDCEGPNT